MSFVRYDDQGNLIPAEGPPSNQPQQFQVPENPFVNAPPSAPPNRGSYSVGGVVPAGYGGYGGYGAPIYAGPPPPGVYAMPMSTAGFAPPMYGAPPPPGAYSVPMPMPMPMPMPAGGFAPPMYGAPPPPGAYSVPMTPPPPQRMVVTVSQQQQPPQESDSLSTSATIFICGLVLFLLGFLFGIWCWFFAGIVWFFGGFATVKKKDQRVMTIFNFVFGATALLVSVGITVFSIVFLVIICAFCCIASYHETY